MTDQALRYNEGKNRLGLMSIPALWQIGLVYTRGCDKYAERNWEKGLPYSQALDCALRHIFKWAAGHKWDAETGLHHLAHAAWNIIAALHMELSPDKYGRFDDLPNYRSAISNESITEYTARVYPGPVAEAVTGPGPRRVPDRTGAGSSIQDAAEPY